jgi:hypothetical protein
MHSGCAAGVLKQKNTGVPMTPPQNRPNIPLMPYHIHLQEF